MEPAFGGVKSSQMPCIPPFAAVQTARRGIEAWASSVYIRYMTYVIHRKSIDRFLRQLRAGGRSNMYGAVPYVMKTFGVDRHAAFTLVCDWLDRQLDPNASEDIRPRSTSRSRK
jgi:hypothetical protein